MQLNKKADQPAMAWPAWSSAWCPELSRRRRSVSTPY